MAKTTAIKRRAPKSQQLTETFNAIDFLMGLPDIQESFTRADIELAIEDKGWQSFSGVKSLGEPTKQDRLITMSKSRVYWRKDPMAKQAVRIWTDYAVGTGVTYKATDPAAQKKIDAFMRSLRNRRLLSKKGQQRLSKKLLVDGDLFFAIFDGDPLSIRLIEAAQVTDIVSDPDDEDHVLYYRRELTSGKALYYADWALDEDGVALAEEQKDPNTGKQITLEQDVKVYHVAFDDIGKFGNGLLSSVVDWAREHRHFMEARVAIVTALAKFAFKATAKGGQKVLNDLKDRLESTLVKSGTAGGAERNPKPTAASTWIQNEGLALEAMPRVTGGSDARNDGDQLKLMMCAGTNIMLHYYGDPSTGNLATATAMELPMKKSFEGYQSLWVGVWRDLFGIVLEEDPEQMDEEVIDIDLPAILDEDLAKLGAYLTQLTTAFPEAKVPEVLQAALLALGINNIDDVMKSIEAKRKEIDAQQKADFALQKAAVQMTPAQAATMKESSDNLAFALKAVAEKL